MEKILNAIARKIRTLDRRRSELAQVLRALNEQGHASFCKKINEVKSQLKICGVDGGFLRKEYHGATLFLRRAVAVLFELEQGRLTNTIYFPSKRPVPEPIIVSSEFSDIELSQLAALKRLEIELKTAHAAAKSLKPDFLILDGSILPHPNIVPEKRSLVNKVYKSVIELYKKLFRLCESRKIQLVGAVEDSRGRKYCTLLLEKIFPALLKSKLPQKLKTKLKYADVLNNSTDTLFLYYLLDVGERTAAIPYTDKASLPALRDLEGWAKAIYATYLKAVEFDRPLRLDFLANAQPEKVAQRIVEVVWALSRHNRAYAYPSVLIEADARAKLTEPEILHFKAAIAEKLGHSPSLFELRRELRPL